MLKKLMVLTTLLVVTGFALPKSIPVSSAISGDNAFMAEGKQAGTTTYDFQQNGTEGNRIVRDKDGYLHMSWMYSASEASDLSFPDRAIYYNVWDPTQSKFLFDGGVKASGDTKAGYTTLGVLNDGRAVVAFHAVNGSGYASAVAVDNGAHLGAFGDPIFLSAGDNKLAPIWPHIAVGSDNVIYVVARAYGDSTIHPNPNRKLMYKRSTDEGATWPAQWTVIDDNGASDAAIAVDPKDPKHVVIAWTGPVKITGKDDIFPPGCHIYYVESTNGGVSWGNKVDITDGYYDPTIDDDENKKIRIATNGDIDCGIDGTGKIHVVFNEFVTSAHDDKYTIYYHWHGAIRHWDEASKKITFPTAHIPMFHNIDTVTKDTNKTLDSLGYWGTNSSSDVRRRGCWQPQISLYGDKGVLVAWCGQFDKGDISGLEAINSDIYAAFSSNGGASWGPIEAVDPNLPEDDPSRFYTNLTKTHTPGAGPGECADERHCSLTPYMESASKAHMTYILDKAAGAVVEKDGRATRGQFTTNPVMYMSVNIMGIEEETPVTGISSIELVGSNVVTNSAVFKVSAPVNDASLKIYDATGALVDVLKVNHSTVTWNAGSVPVGVYFYAFETPSELSKGKLIVVH